jgi:antitoxin component HigA of HigAB toxin-antitoxin module
MPKDYGGLISQIPLRPLHDQVDLANATEIADAMAGHDLSKDQEGYFDVLTTLIEQYEQARVAQPERVHDPIGNLQFLMEQHGMTASDLGRILGQRELGSKILCGERELSKAHIRTLAAHFHVDEIEHDQAAHITEAELAGDFLGSFEIDLEDCGVLIAAAAFMAAGVDVDGDEGFRFINDNVTAALEVNLAGKRSFELP